MLVAPCINKTTRVTYPVLEMAKLSPQCTRSWSINLIAVFVKSFENCTFYIVPKHDKLQTFFK